MLIAVLLLVAVSGALASPWVEMSQARHIAADLELNQSVEHVFAAFKHLHNKQYENGEEEQMRQKIFAVNVAHIKQHNEKYHRGEKSYYLGVNQFTDLTHREFLSFYTGHLAKKPGQSNATTYLAPANVVLPESVDWRTKGYVTDVKNQGQCGSCWSFSATGALEGQHFRKAGKLVSLSEQQLVDCSGSYGNEGCNGGLMDQAFQYIKACGGLESEQDYPYLAEQEDTCKYKKALEKAEVTGFTDVESGSEDDLQNAIATVGPVSIAIDASHSSFQMYAGGVYDEPECSSTELDHGVLSAGYGVDSSTGEKLDYWLVKNSWSAKWGEEGYIRMSRNKQNQCGVATQASYPLV